jgi:hypothetical protein
MGTIYENAFLTIAASWSPNSNCGLFPKKSWRYQPRKMTSPGIYVKGVPVGHSDQVLVQSISVEDPEAQTKLRKAHWPLFARAWVFQERLLSARMIHFGKSELLWECKFGHRSEKKPHLWSSGGPRQELGVLEAGHILGWRRIVREYSQLNLTYESDRLPALAAIVERRMLQRGGAQYVAGIWTDSLVHDLGWYHKHQEVSRPRAQHYVPSWSWASTKGAVAFYYYDPCVSFLDLDATPIAPVQLGRVLKARLHLKGSIFTTSIPKATDHYSGAVSPLFQELSMSFRLQDFDYSANDSLEATMVPVTVLIIGQRDKESLVALVLHKSGDDWERIGLTEIYYSSRIPTTHEGRHQLVQKFLSLLPVEEISIF